MKTDDMKAIEMAKLILKRMVAGIILLAFAVVVMFMVIYIVQNMPNVLIETLFYAVFAVLVVAVAYFVGKSIDKK